MVKSRSFHDLGKYIAALMIKRKVAYLELLQRKLNPQPGLLQLLEILSSAGGRFFIRHYMSSSGHSNLFNMPQFWHFV